MGGNELIEPLGHAVPVGEAGQRIEFGEARIHELALVFGGDVLGETAIALETARFVEDRLGRERPPGLLGLVLRFAQGKAQHQVDDPAARAELELERPLGSLVGVVRIGLEQLGQVFTKHFNRFAPSALGCAFRDVDQAAFGIARPEPAESSLLEVLENAKARGGIARKNDVLRQRRARVRRDGL